MLIEQQNASGALFGCECEAEIDMSAGTHKQFVATSWRRTFDAIQYKCLFVGWKHYPPISSKFYLKLPNIFNHFFQFLYWCYVLIHNIHLVQSLHHLFQ
jgi:hypothetical protein